LEASGDLNAMIQKWKRNPALLECQEYQINNHMALKISGLGFEQILDKYIAIRPDCIRHALQTLPAAWNAFHGKGVDLGGGVGAVSSVIALKQEVQQIYCVEVTENCVVAFQPVVKEQILGDRCEKVISVLGDFDNLQLPSSSIDFAISWDSMHHSADVVKTLNEVHRVLKQTGKLIIVDRAHNNSTPDEEIKRMGNIQYDKTFLRGVYQPEDKKLTRLENGEHDYRFYEWEAFFNNTGMMIDDVVLIKTMHVEDNNKNDAGIKEIPVPYSLGGFIKQKVVYVLVPI